MFLQGYYSDLGKDITAPNDRLWVKSKQTTNTLFILSNPIVFVSYLYDLRIVSI